MQYETTSVAWYVSGAERLAYKPMKRPIKSSAFIQVCCEAVEMKELFSWV